MSHSARESIYEAISSIRLIDPHTHIDPHRPASNTLADLLGYHYYTELAHSAGMPKAEIEQEGLDPRELVRRLVRHLGPIDNTAQYRWLVAICQKFFGFEHDRIDESNWEEAYELAESQMRLAEWPQMVLDRSNVEAVFLTNDFDDELSGFDSTTYIPCLRTDDLVFQLAKPQVRARLEACTGIELDGSLISLRESLRQRFEYFSAKGGRACAISLPPSFQPGQVSDGRTATALDQVLRKGVLAEPQHQSALSRRVFWTLAELCDEFAMPFDLMIGVNRGVYSDGVFQGQDLYDSRVSLIQYADLFNAFPNVKFPISVLASVTNQELVSFAWIFPNVITNGHWWYSNTPSFIARDAAARLEAVPRTKQIAYYSDAYKLEFVWPKFDMYRQILSGILADHFVGSCGWSEERAIELGQQVLRDNVDEVFRSQPADGHDENPAAGEPTDSMEPVDSADSELPAVATSADEDDTWGGGAAAAGASAALAAGAIGMVEVSDAGEPGHDAGEVEPVIGGAGSLEETQDEFATIIEEEIGDLVADAEVPPDAEDIQGFLEAEEDRESEERSEFDSDDDDAVPDRPTVSELDDTVKIETVADEERSAWSSGPVDDDDFDDDVMIIDGMEEVDEVEEDGDVEDADVGLLDPLPTDDEIQAVGLDDVELIDDSAEPPLIDPAAIDAAADPEPMDVGEVLADSDPRDLPADLEASGIRMLRGEESFSPDEDSLQLHADPITGELTLPVPGGDDDLVALSDGDESGFESLMPNLESDGDLADAIVEAAGDSGIAETVDLGDESIDFDGELSSGTVGAGIPEEIDIDDVPGGVDVGHAGDSDDLEVAATFESQDDAIDHDDDNHGVLEEFDLEDDDSVR